MKKNPEKTTSKLLDKFLELRKEQGLSHEKLAKMAGVHRSTISLVESKKITPTILTCLKISNALGVSLNEILPSLGNDEE
ncbi:MAG: DNA-binding XRE family transcriptional regulator [Rickettsiales bacterium]|jgi:DNA-binding XRE family transcriptional regulator